MTKFMSKHVVGYAKYFRDKFVASEERSAHSFNTRVKYDSFVWD